MAKCTLKINIINCTLKVHLCPIYRTLWLHNDDDDDIPTETAIGELHEYRLGKSGIAMENNGKEESELEGSTHKKERKRKKTKINKQVQERNSSREQPNHNLQVQISCS